MSQLTQLIQEAKINLISEERKPTLKYSGRAKAGAKELDPSSDKIRRVEVLLNNKDIPGNFASVVGKIATNVKRLKEVKKQYEESLAEGKQSIFNVADDLFDEADKALNRVIITSAYTISVSKASKREKVNSKKLIEKLKEAFEGADLLIDQLVEECTDITDVASSIDIEVNESLIKEGKIKEFTSKSIKLIISNVKKFISKIKSLFKTIDKNMDEAFELMTEEQKIEYSKLMEKFSDIIKESEEEKETTEIEDKKATTNWNKIAEEVYAEKLHLIELINYVFERMTLHEIKEVEKFMAEKLNKHAR